MTKDELDEVRKRPDAAQVVTVLSLGAGVQSTAIYLLACKGEINIQAAVFADTGDESTATYEHLSWLESLGGPEILRRSLGVHLSASLVAGLNSTGQRFVSIPAFTKGLTGRVGMQRRQCTREFKLRVIERAIRRDVIGLKPRQRIPSGLSVVQLIGFSTDERNRAVRHDRLQRPRGWSVRFPLIERNWDRSDCRKLLREQVPHDVPRSACVFCPYRSNQEWRKLRNDDPTGWTRAVQVDEALRDKASVCTRDMVSGMYLHRSCKPLPLAISEQDNHPLFFQDCEGGCGL